KLGVYDLNFTATQRRLRAPFQTVRPALERKIQLVVAPNSQANANAQAHAPTAALPNVTLADYQTQLEFDPTQPRWWDRLVQTPGMRWMTHLPNWTTSPAAPIDSGGTSVVTHNGRKISQLAGNAWQAFPLPITNPNTPHFIEVEY